MWQLKVLFLGIFLFLLNSCQEDREEATLFKLLDRSETGISFENNLIYDRDFNVYKYRNFYNGGGVSIGDINNDGLPDIYLTANQDSNRLYLNKGNFKFEDISDAAGVSGTRAWSTGVTMVDINADGYLDLYVCNSGDLKGDDKENELFINNGDLTFREEAQKYNLNDKGYSTHASFFDYDKDGDLDVYILNNSYQAIGSFNLKKNERPKRDLLGGDKLMRNDGGTFVDVSEQAGIYGSVIGFGLGITVGDVNDDNWPDIFVSNDFFERDYLYINQQDGTFKEDLTNRMMSISGASMGADLADIDNDGKGEIFVTEMLPFEYERLKTVTTFESWDKYNYNVDNDYHHQFTRNTLHYNNGDGSFSEISRLVNVDATDWSWGALFFDMDNDGFKDLFVSNGIYRDLTDQDYLQYVANEEVIKSIISEDGVNYRELIDIIPSNKVANRSFRNLGNLNFKDYTNSGLNLESFSNGAAYGDLDNDGDLDLVVNNVNMEAFVFENTLDGENNNYLKLELIGEGANPFGIGAKIVVRAGEENYYYEQIPTRGFQSSIDLRPNIGVGAAKRVNVEVKWPSGKVSKQSNVAVNQTIEIKEATGEDVQQMTLSKKYIFSEVPSGIAYERKESPYVDFKRERLLYVMRSNEGPLVSLGDINKDGHIDLVIPGSKGFSSTLFLGNDQGFIKSQALEIDDQQKEAEYVESVLLDVDNDGDLDIYFASGSVEHSPFSPYLFDRLYLNNGDGSFEVSDQKLPNSQDNISTGAIAHADFDGDGDIDLFVGERVKTGSFGTPGSGYILRNNGQGQFSDVTADLAPELKDIGMITDGSFCDLDSDGDMDLVVAGEFMSIVIFTYEEGEGFTRVANSGLDQKGWWNKLHPVDVDGDGDLDIVAGNHGLNSRFKASADHPIRLYVNDYDQNGFTEGILTFNSVDNRDLPYALRHNLVDQLKGLKRKFPDFQSFKNASITEIFTKETLEQSLILETQQLETTLFINNGDLSFSKRSLPNVVQFSPVYAIASGDFDNDGDVDLVCGGNNFKVQPEIGIYDASYGVYLENDGSGNFKFITDSGFFVKGEIRDLKVVGDVLYVIRNSGKIKTFKFNEGE